ncbi:putative ribosome-binding factor A, mitochondrial [Trichomycterus rosablanca]|uniref:putative ribosome-binding factor A, mitochondrial n=1 Tax=Trichomycterus rosablanca TaxID=2290929 RepID=UPI002F3558B2
MLALKTADWLRNCLLPRHVNGLVNVMRDIKLQSAGRRCNSPLVRKRAACNCCHVQFIPAAHFHSSVHHCRNLLHKMFSNKRKKKWYETPQPMPTAQPGFMKPAKKRNIEDSLRVRTLNTVLYKAVSDLLSSHEVNAEIPKYNVEITKVSVMVDYSACRIYWKTSLSSDRDIQIQQALDKGAPRIRYLLISQQILSSVPTLIFVLDKQYAAIKEVENLLKIADYGPREDSENLFPSENVAETKVQTVEKKRIMFGIDHDSLNKQIEDYKQRWSDSNSEISSPAGLTQEQLDTLAEIRKQKLVEKKKRKAKKLKDYDVTPKEYLLTRQLQKEQEEQYRGEDGLEDSQASELMKDEGKH